MNQDSLDIRALIDRCLDGDNQARERFQKTYGEYIYNFPKRKYRLSQEEQEEQEEIGNFYLYVFANDRIFHRIREFEGTHDHFLGFLWKPVLHHLFIEWLRTHREVETVSVDGEEDLRQTPVDPPGPDDKEKEAALKVWNSLTPEEQLDLKLLHLRVNDLTPEDFSLLVTISGRSVEEMLTILFEVQSSLRRLDEQLTTRSDNLDNIWGWILIDERKLQRINEKIHSSLAGGSKYRELIQQGKEMERKLRWRYDQRNRAIIQLQNSRRTTSYDDIARLLNQTPSAVSTRLHRLRRKVSTLRKEWSQERR